MQLNLGIHFTPSLALYIWQSFRKGPSQTEQADAGVEAVWWIAAEVCSTQGCLAESMTISSAFLPALLAADPLQTVLADNQLANNQGDPSHVFKLPQVEPPVRALLLFAQLLAAIAADCKSIFANIVAPRKSIKQEEQLRSAFASKLHQLADTSCCTPVLLPDSTTTQDQAGDPQSLLRPSKRVSMLRSAVLLLKLATLTCHLQADFRG